MGLVTYCLNLTTCVYGFYFACVPRGLLEFGNRAKFGTKGTKEILAMTYLQLTSSIPTIHTIALCYLYTLIRYKENFHTKSLTITPGLKFTSAIGLVYWTFEHVPDWSWYCLSFLFLFSFHTRLLLVLGTFKKLWYWPGPCIGAQDWFLAGMRQVYAWYDMTSLKLEQGRYYLWSLVPISHCY
jgi:hypothetical protein